MQSTASQQAAAVATAVAAAEAAAGTQTTHAARTAQPRGGPDARTQRNKCAEFSLFP